ncbi:hypothetical protein ACI2KR_28030 [Pseudomonas luteola]
MRIAHQIDDVAAPVELVSTAFNEVVATANEVACSCNQAATSTAAGFHKVHSDQRQIDEATGSVFQLRVNLAVTQAMVLLEQDS